MSENFIDLELVAKILRVSKRTVLRLLAKKEIKGFKVGRAWRFAQSDSASHLPIEIKWEQCNRREKPPIVHSQDQSNWRQLVGWNRKSKKCNAQRAVR